MLELIVVAESAGYGDCMFSAVSVALQQLGLSYTAQELRQMTAAYLRENPFVDGDSSNPRWNFVDAVTLHLPAHVSFDREHIWNLYLEGIAKCYSNGGIWGDEMALNACSDMLQVKINVYRYDGVNYQPYGSH